MPRLGPKPDLYELPSGEPATRRERWGAAFYITTAAVLITLVVLAVVFDQFAATGVLLIAFLSFTLAYVIGPAAEWLRHYAAPSRRGRPLPRAMAVLMIYGLTASVSLPFWTLTGGRLTAALERLKVLVPEQTTRFVEQLRASERWHEALKLPAAVSQPIGTMTRRLTLSVEGEVRSLATELAGVRRLVPWLSTVPLVAFVLLTRWAAFRRSTTRVLPPHLQWRSDEFLRHLNHLLAAYTRAQALAALIVGLACWIGFAAIGLPYPGTLGIAAGLLEIVPLAGPIVVAVAATAMAPGQAVAILVFLGSWRIVQDYAIYPRLISRAMHLRPYAVVAALWVGAVVGGLVGVCLAVPCVGVLQVTLRHWREYRDIENLVRGRIERVRVMDV